MALRLAHRGGPRAARAPARLRKPPHRDSSAASSASGSGYAGMTLFRQIRAADGFAGHAGLSDGFDARSCSVSTIAVASAVLFRPRAGHPGDAHRSHGGDESERQRRPRTRRLGTHDPRWRSGRRLCGPARPRCSCIEGSAKTWQRSWIPHHYLLTTKFLHPTSFGTPTSRRSSSTFARARHDDDVDSDVQRRDEHG